MNSEEEQKIVDSFTFVKEDISKICGSLQFVLEKIEKLEKENKRLSILVSKMKPTVIVSKKAVTKKAMRYVASKDGKKLHIANCIHARNIKKRVIFKNKTQWTTFLHSQDVTADPSPNHE